jgi:Bardet-Biedl syndrome 7 protein
LDALKEVQMDDESADFLSQEYRDILANAQQIKADMLERPGVLHALFGIVSDLYVDVNKFSGRNVHDVSIQDKLQQVLEAYSLESVLEFFATY